MHDCTDTAMGKADGMEKGISARQQVRREEWEVVTCQVPSAKRPLLMGTVREQPNMELFTCAGMSSYPCRSAQPSTSNPVRAGRRVIVAQVNAFYGGDLRAVLAPRASIRRVPSC